MCHYYMLEIVSIIVLNEQRKEEEEKAHYMITIELSKNMGISLIITIITICSSDICLDVLEQRME